MCWSVLRGIIHVYMWKRSLCAGELSLQFFHLWASESVCERSSTWRCIKGPRQGQDADYNLHRTHCAALEPGRSNDRANTNHARGFMGHSGTWLYIPSHVKTFQNFRILVSTQKFSNQHTLRVLIGQQHQGISRQLARVETFNKSPAWVQKKSCILVQSWGLWSLLCSSGLYVSKSINI